MSFDAEEVEIMLQVTRDASLGRTVGERLEAITEHLTTLVPSSSLSAILLRRELDGPAQQSHAFFRNGDASNVREYAEHYIAFDPHPAYLAARPGQFLPHSAVVPARDWGGDPFTGEFLRSQGLRYILGGEIPLPGGSFLSFAIHREPFLEDFTTKECQIMGLLAKDLGRAAFGALLRERIAALSNGAEPDDPNLGHLVFAASGELLRADAGGRVLSQRLHDEGRVPPERLSADAQLMAGANLREGDTSEWVISLGGGVFLRAQFTVLDSRPGPPVLCVLQLARNAKSDPAAFDRVAAEAKLSKREREVALLAVSGLGNRHIAHKLGISPVTVGVHLTKIYRKTGAAGRVELARLVSDGNLPDSS